MTLTEIEVHKVLLDALHLAGREYVKLSRTASFQSKNAGTQRLLKQLFSDRAKAVTKLAKRIQQAEAVILQE